MNNKSYYIAKNKKKKEIVSFELEKLDGYQVKPKTKKNDSIEVSKIIFVNKEFSEKIIRKKIDKKISALLEELKVIDEDDSGNNEGAIRKSLMDAEKLRLQIINTYVKYLGHTYEGLTLKKLQMQTYGKFAHWNLLKNKRILLQKTYRVWRKPMQQETRAAMRCRWQFIMMKRLSVLS